jgi:putative FmdB family regulatory protein
MPKYTFECQPCNLQFSRTLKMGEHKDHVCPQCKKAAPRYYPGQGFAFDFAEGATPGNSGVSKHDNPTADQAVGSNADKRWAHYRARARVKDQVRAGGGTHKLIRRDLPGETEYEAMTEPVAKARRALAREAVHALASTNPTSESSEAR